MLTGVWKQSLSLWVTLKGSRLQCTWRKRKRTRIQTEPGEDTELRSFKGWGVSSVDEQRKWFLETKSALGEDAVSIVETATKGWEYINLVDKAEQGSGGLLSVFKEITPCIKCYKCPCMLQENSPVKGGVWATFSNQDSQSVCTSACVCVKDSVCLFFFLMLAIGPRQDHSRAKRVPCH